MEFSDDAVIENTDVVLKNYFSLRFKLKDIPSEKLKDSDDYRRLLRIEHKLRDLRLGLDQIVEMGLIFLTEEEVRETTVYREQGQELEGAKEMYDILRDRYRELVRKVESVLRPQFELKTFIEEQVKTQERDDYK